jgi:hypothetical protein
VALARVLARQARVHHSTLPAARLTTAAADAASVRLADQAWRALGTVDATIIVPTVATSGRHRKPGGAPASPPASAWRAGIDATVRATYLVGRAAGAALARQGGGALLIVVDRPPAGDPIAAVTGEALSCLVDTLGRALRRTVRVGEVSVDRAATATAILARRLLHALTAAPPGLRLVVRSGGRSAG